MTQTKTHWKLLADNSDYIGSYSLMKSGDPQDLTVKILNIKRQPVIGQDGKSDECTVAELEGQKPFIINATNAKTITKIYNSPFIEDWIGKPITLYVAKVKVAGEMIDALRIRPVAPEKKIVDTKKAKAALNAAKTLQELQAAYLSLGKAEQSDKDVIALKDELKKKLK